ncbi:MAG: DUF5131 family protein [Candidatus Heimdallarchaeaceae archaeon]
MKRKMNRTKIDWCDYIWNPVWGCLNDCDYCYGRKIAKRFAGIIAKKEFSFFQKNPEARVKYFDITDVVLYNIETFYDRIYAYYPTFVVSNFEKAFPKKPSRIFVNSMSDIYWWKEDWLTIVLQKIKKYPQHDFLFLSKFPHRYDPIEYKYPSNCWLGLTIDKKVANNILNMQIYGLMNYLTDNIKFVSFEPLNFDPEIVLGYLDVDWIIIGAQTNPYRLPERKWVEELIDFAKSFEIPVFTKDNLARAYPDLVYKEFPRKKEI